jgi:hypothetical protein
MESDRNKFYHADTYSLWCDINVTGPGADRAEA